MKSLTPSNIIHLSPASTVAFSLISLFFIFSPINIALADDTGVTVSVTPSVASDSSNGGSTSTSNSDAPAVSSDSTNGGSSISAPNISSSSTNGGSTDTTPSVSVSSSNGGNTSGTPVVTDTSGNGGASSSTNPPAISSGTSNGGAVVDTSSTNTASSNTSSGGSSSGTSRSGSSSGRSGITSGSGAFSSAITASTTSLPIAISSALIATCTPYLTTFLGRNFDNSVIEVIKLQQFLKTNLSIPLTITGSYDEDTIAAVRAFQVKYASDILTPWGIQTPSGIVYMSTIRTVNSLVCGVALPVTIGESIATSAYKNGVTSAPSSAPRQVNDEIYGSSKTPASTTTTIATNIISTSTTVASAPTNTENTASAASAVKSVPERIRNFFSRIIHIFVK